MSYHFNTSGLGKTLSYNKLKQMRLISLWWATNSGAYMRIPELRFHRWIFLFMLPCFKPGILSGLPIQPTWYIFETWSQWTLNQSYAILTALVSMIYQSRGSVSPICPLLEYWLMRGVICPIVFNFFLSIVVFNISV